MEKSLKCFTLRRSFVRHKHCKYLALLPLKSVAKLLQAAEAAAVKGEAELWVIVPFSDEHLKLHFDHAASTVRECMMVFC